MSETIKNILTLSNGCSTGKSQAECHKAHGPHGTAVAFLQIASVQWWPGGSDDDLCQDFRIFMEPSCHCCHARTTGGKTKCVDATFKDWMTYKLLSCKYLLHSFLKNKLWRIFMTWVPIFTSQRNQSRVIMTCHQDNFAVALSRWNGWIRT